MSKARRSFLGDTQGAAGVEFAMILPLMTVLLFGAFEIGRMFWTYHIVTASARDAARFAARLPLGCGGLLDSNDTTRVQTLARTGLVDGSVPLIRNWTNASSVVVNVSCYDNSAGTYQGRYKDMNNIPRVEVTATAPFNSVVASLLPIPMTSVSASHAETMTR